MGMTAEERLASQLELAGYNYEREVLFFHPHRKWRADFFLKDHSLFIEIEGIRYDGTRRITRHQSGVGFERDCEKYNQMAILKYYLLRFSPDMVWGWLEDGRKINLGWIRR